MYTSDEIQDKKRAFALAFMRYPTDPARAAREVETRSAYISFILNNWQFDDEVQAYMLEIREQSRNTGTAPELPSKEQFAATLWKEAQECRTKDTKLDYLKLMASVMGYIEKPSNVTNINNTMDNRKVIVLPAKATSLDDWAANAKQQQARLTSGAV